MNVIPMDEVKRPISLPPAMGKGIGPMAVVDGDGDVVYVDRDEFIAWADTTDERLGVSGG